MIVPTGGLASLPWSLLPSCAGRAVSVAPSAALWTRAATAPSTGSGVLLAHGPGLEHAAAEVRAIARIRPDAARLGGPEGPRGRRPRRDGRDGHHAPRHARHLPRGQPDVLPAAPRRRSADGLRPRAARRAAPPGGARLVRLRPVRRGRRRGGPRARGRAALPRHPGDRRGHPAGARRGQPHLDGRACTGISRPGSRWPRPWRAPAPTCCATRVRPPWSPRPATSVFGAG